MVLFWPDANLLKTLTFLLWNTDLVAVTAALPRLTCKVAKVATGHSSRHRSRRVSFQPKINQQRHNGWLSIWGTKLDHSCFSPAPFCCCRCLNVEMKRSVLVGLPGHVLAALLTSLARNVLQAWEFERANYDCVCAQLTWQKLRDPQQQSILCRVLLKRETPGETLLAWYGDVAFRYAERIQIAAKYFDWPWLEVLFSKHGYLWHSLAMAWFTSPSCAFTKKPRTLEPVVSKLTGATWTGTKCQECAGWREVAWATGFVTFFCG